jgi:hypothetical protein
MRAFYFLERMPWSKGPSGNSLPGLAGANGQDHSRHQIAKNSLIPHARLEKSEAEELRRYATAHDD